MTNKPTSSYRVIVAQAEPTTRKNLVDALKKQTRLIVVGVTGDGLEFIDMARTLKPDLLIVNLTLTSLDGLAALGRLNTKEFAGVRRMVLSNCSGFVEDQAVAVGADLFVMTPASCGRVAQLAFQLVDASRRTAELTDHDIIQETWRILQELLPLSRASRTAFTDVANGVLLLAQGKKTTRFVTEDLYPAIGACRGVEWKTVERSIRVLINDIWKSAPLTLLEASFPRYFQSGPYEAKKPTAACFLADLTSLVTNNLQCRWRNHVAFNWSRQCI